MRKVLIALFCVLGLLFVSMPAQASLYVIPDPEPPTSMEGIETIDGVIYRIIGEDTAEVGYNAPRAVDQTVQEIVIPQTVTIEGKSYRVTAISGYAFADCHDLTNVVLPEGITYIGEQAFRRCSNLRQIDLPDTLQILEKYAFRQSGLESITIPGSVKTIPERCFSECRHLTTVTLEEGVEAIGLMPFASTSLTTLTLPQSLTTIGELAFYGYHSETLVLPDGVRNLEPRAFLESTFKEIILPEGITYISEECFAYSDIFRMTIPSTVTEIGAKAFAFCPNLTRLYVPKNVEKLGHSVFGHAPLQMIYTGHDSSTWEQITSKSWGYDKVPIRYVCEGLPETLNTGDVFQYESVIYKILDLPTADQPGEVQVGGGKGSALPHSFQEIEIPEYVTHQDDTYRVTAVGADALLECETIQLPDSIRILGRYSIGSASVNLPESLEIIEENALAGTEFHEINLPSGLKFIREGAFQAPFSYPHIDHLIIPEGVESIGNYAFENYTFSKITLPSSLKHLGEHAFSSVNLEEIVVAEDNPVLYLEDGVLFIRTQEGIVLLNYPSGKEGSEYTVPEGVTAIGDGAFEGCRLTKVTLPEGVTRIGEVAFRDSCLEEIVLPEGMTRIGDNAFYGSAALTKLNIPASVEAIGSYAFLETGANLRINTTHTRQSWTALVNHGDKGLLYQTLIVGEPFWFIWKPIGLCLFGAGSCLIIVVSGIWMRKRKKSMEEPSRD